MTPPLSKANGPKPVEPGIFSIPDPKKDPKAPVKKDVYVSQGDTAKAKASVKLEDLVPAVGDEQLFGIFNAKYQPEKNKKYLKVTLALLAVRKFLGGDEAKAAEAKDKIVEWLSDGKLYPDKTAHEARKNLIKVLEKAAGDSNVDELLKVLKANYTTAAVAKTKEEILSDISDLDLFEEFLKTYTDEKNKKYLKVTLSLLAIRKYLGGDASKLEEAKGKIVEWLSDADILRDDAAVKARKNLIKLLNVTTDDATLNADLQSLVKLLKANYSVSSASAKEEKTPAPPPEKGKGEKTKAGYKYSFSIPTKKGGRKDNADNVGGKLNSVVSPPYNRFLKNSEAGVSADMKLIVDPETGYVKEVRFENIKINGSANEAALENLFKAISTRAQQTYSFEKGIEVVQAALRLIPK